MPAGKGASRIKRLVPGAQDALGGTDVEARLKSQYSTLPAFYRRLSLGETPTAEGMAALLQHVKSHVAGGPSKTPPSPPSSASSSSPPPRRT